MDAHDTLLVVVADVVVRMFVTNNIAFCQAILIPF
jgi:hypothetical protein